MQMNSETVHELLAALKELIEISVNSTEKLAYL